MRKGAQNPVQRRNLIQGVRQKFVKQESGLLVPRGTEKKKESPGFKLWTPQADSWTARMLSRIGLRRKKEQVLRRPGKPTRHSKRMKQQRKPGRVTARRQRRQQKVKTWRHGR